MKLMLEQAERSKPLQEKGGGGGGEGEEDR
jgi:hypothetical protein